MATRQRTGEPLPYYRWYWRDWRGSRQVQKMTALERGIYRELLDEQWRVGHLVNDPEWLAEAAMCTADELASVWQVLGKCFPPVEGSDGKLLANERIEAERTEVDRQRVNRTIAGQLGGKAKAKQVLASAKQVSYSSSRAEQSSSNEPEANAVAALRLVGASAPACECDGEHLTDCPNRPADPVALSDILATLRTR
jgi:uncharacterized protein YdaU (DUF1376 family)